MKYVLGAYMHDPGTTAHSGTARDNAVASGLRYGWTDDPENPARALAARRPVALLRHARVVGAALRLPGAVGDPVAGAVGPLARALDPGFGVRRLAMFPLVRLPEKGQRGIR